MDLEAENLWVLEWFWGGGDDKRIMERDSIMSMNKRETIRIQVVGLISENVMGWACVWVDFGSNTNYPLFLPSNSLSIVLPPYKCTKKAKF